MSNTLTKTDFDKLLGSSNGLFTEYKARGDFYRIEYLESFLKCVVQKTEEGVQIVYLDSFYNHPEHQKMLMGYVEFKIAHEINGNKRFKEIEFNKDGKILKVK